MGGGKGRTDLGTWGCRRQPRTRASSASRREQGPPTESASGIPVGIGIGPSCHPGHGSRQEILGSRRLAYRIRQTLLSSAQLVGLPWRRSRRAQVLPVPPPASRAPCSEHSVEHLVGARVCEQHVRTTWSGVQAVATKPCWVSGLTSESQLRSRSNVSNSSDSP